MACTVHGRPGDNISDTPLIRATMGILSEALKRSDWVVVGKTGCPYCSRARGLLTACGLGNHVYIDMTELDRHAGGRAELDAVSGHLKTVPRIFHKGRLVGGYSDLVALEADSSSWA